MTARLMAVVGSKQGFEALEAIAVFASATGYDVTLDDVEAVHRHIERYGVTGDARAGDSF